VRLIKYFDNSLFKLIKDFTPAKTNLASGLVIKPHFLERNRYQVPSVEWEQLEKSSSIDTAFITGSIAGGFEEFAGEDPFIRNYIFDFTQSWSESIVTPLGLVNQIHNTQDEFYNGEFSGSIVQIYEEQVNPFLDISTTENSYTVTQYIGKRYRRYESGPRATGYYVQDEIIFEEKFLNSNTEPDQGEIYLFNECIDPRPIQSFSPIYEPQQYRNKFIKISKFNSNGTDNSIALGQATQINILMKNGSGTINISFPIQNVTEYSTYYLYEISDPEIPSIVSVLTYGTLYNLTLLLEQSPIIPVNVYNNDNEIRNGGVPEFMQATSQGVVLPAISIIRIDNQISLNQPTVFDGFGYGNFNTSSFSYVFEKTPNVDNIKVGAIGTIPIGIPVGGSPGIRKLILCKKNINQPSSNLEILTSQSLSLGSNVINLNFTLSGSYLPVENDEIFLIITSTTPGNIPTSGFEIVKFFADYTTPSQPNTPDLVITEPYFEIDFTNNDYNALFGNAFEARKSQYYMDVDYSTSPIIGSSLTPINFTQLIEGIATKAQVQDYYYNLQRHTIPRYEGSETTAAKFNEYTNGDTGYGKEIVAGNLKPFVGYYTSKGGSTPEVLGKTIVNLDYIIDEDINTQVPALSDFTYNNQIQLFERGTNLYLDPDKNSINEQFAGVNKYKIYRSGEYATPILYTQTGSFEGFIDTLTFSPIGAPSIDSFFNTKTSFYQNNTSNDYNVNSFFRLARRIDLPYWTILQTLGFTNPYDSFDNNNDNPYTQPFNNPIPFYPNIAPQYWNQLIFDTPLYTDQSISYDYIGGSPFRVFKFNTTNVTLGVQCKVKTSITLKWNPPSSINYNLKLQLRIVSLPANGYQFPILAGGNNNFETIAPGETKTFEIETPPFIPSNNSGVFVQGRVLLPTTSNNSSNLLLYNDYQLYATIENSNFEIIQVPESNLIEIEYTPPTGNSLGTPYITGIQDTTWGINGPTNNEGYANVPVSLIFFTSSFSQAYGKIYPKVSGSGYDETIYPFEIFPNNFSQVDNSQTPEFEIRFAANEELSFPIIGSVLAGQLILMVARPEGYSLENNIIGDTRQSFLIRRWIPKAGYIYLEAGNPPNGLGKGIIKPEYITKGIQDKIPTIVKELTDKGLIQ
jgi:hypothetical protein